VACNLACQSYLDWSRRTLNGSLGTAAGASNSSARRAAKETPRKRVSKRVVPPSFDMPPQKKKTNDLQGWGFAGTVLRDV
jgi:hypothetical protein